MATVIQKERARAGAGVQARALYAQAVSLTMVAGATATGTITVPSGSWLSVLRSENTTAFTGAPTNINLTIGNVAAGAQGHVGLTIVGTFDVQAGTTTYFFTLTAVGGTAPAGTATVVLAYYPPNP